MQLNKNTEIKIYFQALVLDQGSEPALYEKKVKLSNVIETLKTKARDFNFDIIRNNKKKLRRKYFLNSVI